MLILIFGPNIEEVGGEREIGRRRIEREKEVTKQGERGYLIPSIWSNRKEEFLRFSCMTKITKQKC